ncbi:MAG TPA: phosphoribosylformylglycinamidine cyclo-ligase [Gemmatimonadaceae bacterium]|nr:phosphoribosylformylglycinamidine cyclo-ligase [Gemmatimonadaceae bacterium]
MKEDALRYGSAGVNLEASNTAKQRIRKLVESTLTAGAVGPFGGFGGMFRVPPGLSKPVLVASADGVGTKVKVAIDANRHETIGRDLVNHCVNDILVQGALPLFFLDYVAFGRLDPAVVEAVVAGVAAGCRENGCALIGGETAEMPGLYTPPDYDLAGFIVGYVEEDRILGPQRVRPDDILIGLASAGLHTNGYSLARKIVAERLKLSSGDRFPETDRSVGEVLLAEHRSYLGAVKPVLDCVHSMAHITGGGLPGNVDRAIPASVDAVIDRSTWKVPTVFKVLERAGRVEPAEMYRSFNMGVGMVVICAPADVETVLSAASLGEVPAWVLGSLKPGTGTVILS